MVQFASSSGIVDSFRNATAWGQQQQQYRNQLAQDAALRDALGKLPADATLDQEWQALRQGYSAAPGGGTALAGMAGRDIAAQRLMSARMAMGQLQYQRAIDAAKVRGEYGLQGRQITEQGANARNAASVGAINARTGMMGHDAQIANEAKAHEMLGAALEKNDPGAVQAAVDFARQAGVSIDQHDIDYYKTNANAQRMSGFLSQLPDGDYKNTVWQNFQHDHDFNSAIQAAGPPPAKAHAGARGPNLDLEAEKAWGKASGDPMNPAYGGDEAAHQKYHQDFVKNAGPAGGGLDPQNPLGLPPVGQNRLGLQRPGAKAAAPAPAAAAVPAPALVSGAYDGSQDEADQQQQDDEDDALLYGAQ